MEVALVALPAALALFLALTLAVWRLLGTGVSLNLPAVGDLRTQLDKRFEKIDEILKARGEE